MKSSGDQVAIEAVAKAKALEMQKKKQAQMPMQHAHATSNVSRMVAAGIWIAALASLVGVFYSR